MSTVVCKGAFILTMDDRGPWRHPHTFALLHTFAKYATNAHYDCVIAPSTLKQLIPRYSMLKRGVTDVGRCRLVGASRPRTALRSLRTNPLGSSGISVTDICMGSMVRSGRV